MPYVINAVEELVDLKTSVTVLDGTQWSLTTALPLRHALATDGSAACGLGADGMVAAARPWDAPGLPARLRCAPCLVAVPVDDPPGAVPGALPDLRTAAGLIDEQRGVDALADALAPFDLRRWLFTDLVTIDNAVRGGFSHPLTLSPRLVLRSPLSALATFLHEQLHWFVGEHPGLGSAWAEARQHWPCPPPPPAGCHAPWSTWLHMSVCALEYLGLRELIGREAAQEELGQHVHYSWLYDQVLDDPDWYAGYLGRHGMALLPDPPVPRRFVSSEPPAY